MCHPQNVDWEHEQILECNEKTHFLQSNDLKTSLHSHFQGTLDREILGGSFSLESYQVAERERGGEIEELCQETELPRRRRCKMQEVEKNPQKLFQKFKNMDARQNG